MQDTEADSLGQFIDVEAVMMRRLREISRRVGWEKFVNVGQKKEMFQAGRGGGGRRRRRRRKAGKKKMTLTRNGPREFLSNTRLGAPYEDLRMQDLTA